MWTPYRKLHEIAAFMLRASQTLHFKKTGIHSLWSEAVCPGHGAPTKGGPAPQHFLQGHQELTPPFTPQSDPRTNRYSSLGWEGP